MKPASFDDLPAAIQARLLDEMELDYDGYESSKAEVIHQIGNGHINSTNKLIIANYYKAVSVGTLLVYAKQELEAINHSANALTQFIRDCAV